MKKKLIIFLSLLIGVNINLLCRISYYKHKDLEDNMYYRIFQEFKNLDLCEGKSASVSNFKLRQDSGEFLFKDGRITMLTKVSDKQIAALFVGEGSFKCLPPVEVECDQLERVFGVREYKKVFDSVFMVFGEDILNYFTENLDFNESINITNERSKIKKAIDYLSYDFEDTSYLNERILMNCLNSTETSFFSATIFENYKDPIFFEVNPFKDEEIRILRRAKNPGFLNVPEVVCQFSKDHDKPELVEERYENRANLNIHKYNLEVNIDRKMNFSGTAEIDLSKRKEGVNWDFFHLYHRLEVDSILTSDGERVEFFKGNNNPYLWINLPCNSKPDQIDKIIVYYSGDLILKGGRLMEIREYDYWYPLYISNNNVNYDVSFKLPKKYHIVSVGTNYYDEIDGDYRISKWKTEKPVHLTTFSAGVFKEESLEDSRIPTITMKLSYKNQDVMADVANSFNYFQTIFGELDLDKFYVGEIASLRGEAYTGLINLSKITFMDVMKYGADETFRAHEVAHQWWGISVDHKTYHDQWLSEGLAEYSSMMYLQNAVGRNDLFFQELRQSKKAILGNRDYLLTNGQEAAPIWLGYRTSSSTTRGDHYLMIYAKSAWVFHMLRNLSLDLKTLKDTNFLLMIQDYFETYKGKDASTEDFKRVVEKHLKIDMDWFFKQWVYNSYIPVYDFQYKLEEVNNGQYKAHCTIYQKDVPDDFEMYIPVKIDFGKQGCVYMRIHVKGPVSELDLPLLPMKPKKIEFNVFESVLCKSN